MHKAIIVASICFAFSALSYSIAIYNVAAAQSEAIVATACMDGGGQWLKNWGPTHSCVRSAEK